VKLPRADRVPQSTSVPDGPVPRPVSESPHGESRDADRSAYCCAYHACKKSHLKMFRPLKGIFAPAKRLTR